MVRLFPHARRFPHAERPGKGLMAIVLLLAALQLSPAAPSARADSIDDALAHPGRPEADLKRDALDHPADVLKLAAIKPGMTVADVLAGDGYYSEILSYLVGPTGHVLLIDNTAFDKWGEGWHARLAGDRLPNVKHETLDLNAMQLAPHSLDAVLLIKVYHDLYWVDSRGTWPKIDVGSVLDQLAQALKPHGVLLLVDHSAKKGHGSSDAGTLHRIEESFAIKDFKAHGFKLVGKSDVLRMPLDERDQISYKGPMLGKTDRFVLVFRKT
jgi:predicted methyltransferase